MLYSDISEAWKNDPVKEMTNKLSMGTIKSYPERSEIFNFKNYINNPKKDTLSLTESISIMSDGESPYETHKSHIPYASFTNKFDKSRFISNNHKQSYPKKYKKYTHRNSSDFSDMVSESKCDYSIRHLRKCNRCYDKIRQLINSQVNKKLDEIILDNKMKQIQNNIPVSQPIANNTASSDSWKETLIIISGAIIALFIIFLIVKLIYK